jgi:hypothetical protein
MVLVREYEVGLRLSYISCIIGNRRPLAEPPLDKEVLIALRLNSQAASCAGRS